MKTLSRFFRLAHINFVLLRYNLDEFIFASRWFSPLRFLSVFNPFAWFSNRNLSRGERIRKACESLGPIFIKAGQLLATRRDLLPDDIADELAKLQDQVPPFPGRIARQIIETSLKSRIEDIFQEFEEKALASASIAQVHAATLLNGDDVVVKVLRPNIKNIVERDIDLLMMIAKLANKYWTAGRRFKPIEIMREITHTLYDELDLIREAANASQLRRNFLHHPFLYIPDIYWPYCQSDVIVLERIYGIPIHHISALREAGMDMKKIAERGIEIFFTQVFRDSFFHADMHPGNIFISTEDPNNPKFIAVDFGIMGSLNTKDQRYLAENMLAFFQRDYQKVAELHLASGWLPPDTRVDQFEGAIRAVCEPIFERPLKDISFGQLLLNLFQAARRYHIVIQPQLILLQKTLLTIEGVCRQLYPDLDIWTTATPFIEKWLKKQVGFKAFFKQIRQNLPYWMEKLPEIPGLIYDVLQSTHQLHSTQHYLLTLHKTSQNKKSFSFFWYGFLGGMLLIGIGLLYSYSST